MIDAFLLLATTVAAQPAPPLTPAPDAKAETPKVEAEVAQAKNTDDDDRVVCKKYAQTGTRVKRKVCHTAAQWQQMADHAQRVTQGIHDKGAVAPAPETGG